MEQASDKKRPLLGVVRHEELSELIRARRKRDDLTLEQAAQQCGVGPATLWRLERRGNGAAGKRPPEPDTTTLSAVIRWLGIPLNRVLDSSSVEGDIHNTKKSMPDIIEAHLRADRNLDPQAAAALGKMFRAAYEGFQQSSKALGTTTGANDTDK